MTSFKKTSILFLIALGLLGAACGDDKKDSDGKPSADAGGNGGTDAGGNGGSDAGGGDDKKCSGGYTGFTEQQIVDNIKDPAGACTSAADIDGVCTKNPSGKAKDIGVPCYFAVSNDKTLTPEQVGDMTGECALAGRGDLPGLSKTLKGMSNECIDCYVDAVVCSAQNCPVPCGTGSDEECTACRDEKGCTDAFYVCAGLPTDVEIEAAK